MGKYVTAAEAVQVVKSGDRVYVQAAAATPTILTKALADRASELRNVEVCHLHTEGDAPYANPELAESFHVNSFFIGANVRHTLKAGNGSYTPVFLSELPLVFRKNVVKLDVAFIHVSPPDSHGYCSLGVSVEASVAANENAKMNYEANHHIINLYGFEETKDLNYWFELKEKGAITQEEYEVKKKELL